MSVKRVTTRTVNITDDLGVRLRREYSDKEFRPNRFVESLTESSIAGPVYEVGFSGPTMTTTGKDHASSSGRRRFDDRNPEGSRISDIPPVLAGLLVGADVLRGAVR
jgi:hypothetical protein